jgi:hypothetical protein
VPYYRTEVVIPPDRYLCLQLPNRLPEGPAIVTVMISETGVAEIDNENQDDPDREDIEWWEEFEDDSGPRDRPAQE